MCFNKDLISLPKLNLPELEIKIKKDDDVLQVFDEIRRIWLKLTPEEWVRQNFLKYLKLYKKYPSGLIAIEFSVKYGKLTKRPDAVIYSKNNNPLVIIEFKAPTVKITNDVFLQAFMYNSQLGVDLFFVSNGLEHYACRVNHINKNIEFFEDIPFYDDLD